MTQRFGAATRDRFHKLALPGALLLAFACSAAYAADPQPQTQAKTQVHTPSLPQGVVLPADKTGYAYFEGERAAKEGDAFKDEAQKERTFYCEKNSPDDRFWSSSVPYDQSRFGVRGADTDQPWHMFLWDVKKTGLADGVYDAFARVMISGGGSCELGVTTGANPPEKPVAAQQANILWVRVGSVELNAQTPQLRLYLRTKKSAVRLDTLLLVRAAPQSAAVFERTTITPPAWQRGEGLVFNTDSAQLGYQAAEPQTVRAVSASVRGAWQGAQTWQPLARSPEGDWRVSLPEPGWYEVQVKAEFADGAVWQESRTAAVLGDPIPEERRQQSTFGLWNVHGDAELVRIAGARWNRRMVSFRDVTQEQITASASEGAHPYLNREGLDYIGVFAFGMPLWSMKLPDDYKPKGFGNPFTPAKDWNQISDIVRAYANSRALPQIMEMYNEPLAHWKGTKAELVEYAAAVRKGLLATGQPFELAGPCLYSIRIGDLEALAKAGLFQQLDAISMHAYVNGTRPEGEFLEKIVELRELLARHGQQKKPVYLTEFGWTAADGTWQPPVDRATQTRYVARSLALAWSQKIDALIYFVLKFETKNTGEAAFSLFDNADRPQPGYVAFAAVSRFFAGSQPLGHYRLTPDVHMVAGRRGERAQLALWSAGADADIRLPLPALQAKDIFGKTLLPLPQTIRCTAEPVYLEVDAATLGELTQAEPVTLTDLRALKTPVEWPLLASAASTPPPGRYAGFHRSEKGWQIVPVELVTPLTIRSTSIVWPLDKEVPQVLVTVASNLGDREQTASIWMKDEERSTLQVPPLGLRQVLFPVQDFQPAARRRSSVRLQCPPQEALTSTLEWATLAASEASEPLPWADFTDYASFGKPGEGGSCRGSVRMRHSAEGLRVEVRVTDDEHAQPEAEQNPDRLWSADSIQIAFDMDSGKPWSAGVVGAGLSEHRVFEFSVGAKTSGTAQVFRDRSFTDGLEGNKPAPNVKAVLKREGNVTAYDVLFPWSELAVSQPMQAGGVIGFSLAVNDIDPARKAGRHGVYLFGGIVQNKDAKEFGQVWLR